MPSLQSLPTELLYLILAELDNHRGTLLALQLVSRSVRAASESLLYRTISFPRWNESRLKQLVDTLYWSGERLCHHIDGFRISAREVKISTETGARICEVLKRCVNLSSLSLDFFRKKGNKGSSPFFALLDSAPFSLSTLSWTGLIPKEARLFIDFLASQSSLRYLDLTLPPSQELSCIPLSALPCLQLVRTGEAIDNIAAIFADRPNITHLHLRRVPNSMFSQLAQESVSNIRTLTCLHLNGRINILKVASCLIIYVVGIRHLQFAEPPIYEGDIDSVAEYFSIAPRLEFVDVATTRGQYDRWDRNGRQEKISEPCPATVDSGLWNGGP
ncbi:hypothetical protein EYR40_010445 [Pleurotus pulmonarius]|nr:hypothetical protein EYR36_010168 [Pleurotus pulmonarius]KAF4588890.1 hypothetical protein EYR40_010445 [Pleurotus pulmonarius]